MGARYIILATFKSVNTEHVIEMAGTGNILWRPWRVFDKDKILDYPQGSMDTLTHSLPDALDYMDSAPKMVTINGEEYDIIPDTKRIMRINIEFEEI